MGVGGLDGGGDVGNVVREEAAGGLGGRAALVGCDLASMIMLDDFLGFTFGKVE